MRAGRFVQQSHGYIAFEPAPLPPDPPVQLHGELSRLLSAADIALGRLDGITGILPNPDLFVAMYVRQEAVLSSQIEGTQAATIEEKLGVSYVTANNHVARLEELGILQEMTGYKRNRRFSFGPYLALFESAAPTALATPALSATSDERNEA